MTTRAYSITFGAIRQERRTWRLRHDLDQLAADTDPDNVPIDLGTITVINDWRVVHIGHATTPNANLPSRSPNATAPSDATLRPSGGQ